MKHSNFSVKTCTVFSSVLFFLTVLSASAQEDFKPKLGLIDRLSVEMKAYPNDSTADAVVLYDYGKVNFLYDERRGFYMEMDCWMRIKILKESALDRASVSLSFYDANVFDKSEVIQEISGYTYNLNGNQVETTQMDKKSIKREKLAENISSVKFNLPNVKKGSVIEYRYTKITPFKVQDKPDTWRFQSAIPVKWSEFNIIIPQFLNYQIIMGGYLPLFKSLREGVNVTTGNSRLDGAGLSYRFVMKDAPAFTNEPFITTANDYLSKISFELASIAVPGEIIKQYSQTWEQVDETFTQATWFGAELKKNVFSKDIKDAILKGATDSTEKMNLGYAYIQKNMKWDDTKSTSARGGIKKAFDNKKGNASEINLLLTNLLRELNLDCDPVVLSTRSNGQVLEHLPSLEVFNYVVCRVHIGNNEYLLDATQVNSKPGLLPEHALNGRGRVIPKKGTGYFVNLASKDTKNKLEMITADILPDEGVMKGSYSVSLGGYEALNWRNQYGYESDQVYTEDFKKLVPEWKVQAVSIENKTKQLSGAVNIQCNFEVESESDTPGLFYFNPMLVARMHENPLKSPDRIYPLDLTSGISSSFIGKFKLPEGYTLEETPKGEVITLPDKAGRFLFQVKQTGNVIQVNSTMIVNKIQFLPEEYADLREFFERVVQKHAQPLVIKKK
jgi:hypothetical protein